MSWSATCGSSWACPSRRRVSAPRETSEPSHLTVPSATPSRRLSRRALLRFLALALVLAAAYAVLRWPPVARYVSREALIGTFEALRQTWWAPPAFIAATAVGCTVGVPATALVVVGAMVFGLARGMVYNILGTFLGALLSFELARTLGREFVAQLVGPRLRRVEKLLNRRGFWALVRIRFIPLPFPLVNYGAALVGIRLPVFAVTTALGLVPAIGATTWAAAALFTATVGERKGVLLNLVLAFGLFLSLTLIPTAIRRWQRARRYRELLARRRGGPERHGSY